MPRRSSKAVIADLAAQAGANTRLSWPRRVARLFLRHLKPSAHSADANVLIVGGDLPRDLDDRLSDPAVQSRIGKAIANQAKKSRRRG